MTGRRIVRGLLLFGCLALVVSGAFLAISGHGTGHGLESTIAAAETEDGGENETVRHQDPATYDEDGDSDSLVGWLERSLSDRLEESTLELSQGEYDAARSVIDEEYREQFGQLVDVAGETGSYDTDDENESSPEEDFEDAQERQEHLADLLEEFDETLEEYEDAVDAGEQERARELARDLEALADEINELSDDVEIRFERLTDGTDADLSESTQAINETSQEVDRQRTVVRSEQFEETTLTLEAADRPVSFLEPLEADGRLTTADGTPIADETITLDVEGDRQQVHTDADGAFTLEYRPVDQPVSTDEITVRYVPDESSEYLGTETTVPVSLEQVEPTLTVLETSGETAYGEEIRVAGELAASDVPVDDVPLEVLVGGERLGEVRVSDGSFDGTVETEATPQAGEHDLTVRLPFEDRTLASTDDTTSITVLETETDVSIAETEVDGDTLHVNGNLSTADGDVLAGESIRIDVDGSPATTGTTTDDGQFNETVDLPVAPSDDEVEVAAAYDGSGTNLAPAGTTATVTLETSTTSGSSWSVVLGGGVLAGAALAVGAFYFLRRRRSQTPSVGTTDEIPNDSEEPTPELSEPLIERASEYLSEGQPTMAIRAGYAAVRRAARSEGGDDRALTHWEFYQHYRGQDREALKRITEEYERATYTPESVSDREAMSVLEQVGRFCETTATVDGDIEVADD